MPDLSELFEAFRSPATGEIAWPAVAAMISAVGAVAVFALSKATELISAYVAHRRRRSAFIRALFAEIEFNTDELRVFTAQRRPKADLEAFFAGGADRRPHITDARHTIIYQRNIDLISFVDDGLVRKIVAFYGELEKLKAQVDGLLAKLTPVSHVMPRDFEEAVAVNIAACWRMIRTCDPPLRAAPAGRAVVLTDALAEAPAAYWGLYGFGKAAQAHLALAWAAEVATTPLRVNLFDPGAVATRLRAAAMPGEDQSALPRPADVAPAIAALCLPGETRHGAVVRRGPPT